MNRFFKWLTGRARKERKFCELPLLFPESLEGQYGAGKEESSKNLLLTGEYVDPKNPRKREYCFAEKQGDGAWHVSKITRQIQTKNECDEQYLTSFADAVALVAFLSDYDLSQSNDGKMIVGGNQPTYEPFAIENGLLFDENGKIFKVSEATGRQFDLDKAGLEALDKNFNDNAAKARQSLKTWAEVYEHIVNASSYDFSKSVDTAYWSSFEREMQPVLKDLKQLHASVTMRGESALRSVTSMEIYTIARFPEAQQEAVVSLVEKTRLIALLRAGQKIYANTVAQGNLDPTALSYIRDIGQICSAIAHEKFGFDQKLADQIKNVMMTGPDTVEVLLPAEKALAPAPVRNATAARRRMSLDD